MNFHILLYEYRGVFLEILQRKVLRIEKGGIIMRKTTPSNNPQSSTHKKLTITPEDLGYDTEFDTEAVLSFVGKKAGKAISEHKHSDGTPRDNLSIYPGE